jgi:opacity protein-like surface antigen
MRFVYAAAALLPLITAAQAEDLTYDVRSGQTVTEQMYIYLPGCISYGQYRSKVLKEPSHGKLVIRPETFIAAGPPCDGRKFVGTKLSYTSAKGFRGTDTLSVNLGYPIDSSGMQYTYTTYNVTLNVR